MSANLMMRSQVAADPVSPMTWLRVFELPCEVVSCREAANAKGFPLRHELKSLILKTDEGFAVVHLSGSEFLSLRQVKRFLKSDQARLATPHETASLGARPGAVSPFLPNLWRLPHLIDTDLLTLTWVSTNNGTLNSYIVFDPILLSRAETSSTGQFRRIE
ncbi:YbaK/EbsC family protein [Catenulispora sp. NF23]|uniref:YbaK/EbsC family protein n=1 Tax=Catenulispora pinistramenti TaxID=2705254 RepID=A0ABS5KP90_9ACTN|nr:YbaK/EbsC family protein [Catenulispora pinistramenti]MBS2532727.1 YbaK/EbsC family protein [Catenulispora pinistramenti]MBS2547856.1 YbaK/EbsC family protein [Catenulispora pinistramenti]